MIPLYDDNPVSRISHAWVNWALIAANVVVYFVFQSGYVQQAILADAGSLTWSLGMIPVVLFQDAVLPPDLALIPEWLTPVTSLFLHGSWMHLAGNMLFLWVLGDNIEDDLGHFRYALFYVACGVAAALAHAFANPVSQNPLIGASGAVSGVVAAYVLLHPRVTLWVLVLFRIPLPLPAWTAIGGWILFQAYNAWTAASASDVAWYAHLGGLLAGAVLVVFLRQPGVPLFDKPRPLRVEEPVGTDPP